jgi:SAM-dependent methyltransferase
VTAESSIRPIVEVQSLVRSRSTLPPEQTDDIIRRRFQAPPRRLVAAAKHWPLTSARVLDVGCSYGHCLVHFGPGSVGLDNVPEHVEFCRALGLDARLADVESDFAAVDNGEFDAIWVSDILEHLDAPRPLIRRLAPKLKPGGRLVLYLTVLPPSRVARRVFARRGFFDADVHHYQFTVETARYLVERAGYAIEEVVPHTVPRALARFAPTVFIAAHPDPAAEAHARDAEQRNRPL